MDVNDHDGRIDAHSDNRQLLSRFDEKRGPVLVDGTVTSIEAPQVRFDVFLGPHGIHSLDGRERGLNVLVVAKSPCTCAQQAYFLKGCQSPLWAARGARSYFCQSQLRR